MRRLVFESWLLLIRVEWIMHCCAFQKLYQAVKEKKAVPYRGAIPVRMEDLCRAVDYACVFYFKRVLCLQRSAATTLLLRRYGLEAELVIGAKLLPFRSHAWVELGGQVINDRPYMHSIYQVLERC